MTKTSRLVGEIHSCACLLTIIRYSELMKQFRTSLVAAAVALTGFSAQAEVYQVVDLGGVDDTRHSFALGVNAHGDAVGISRDHFNFPVNFDTLNFDAIEARLTSIRNTDETLWTEVNMDDIRNGVLNAQGLDFIRLYFDEQRGALAVQKVGNQTSFITPASTPVNSSEITYFDQELSGFGGKTRSTLDQTNAINDAGETAGAGTAVYRRITYQPPTPEDGETPDPVDIWYADFMERRGVVTTASGNVEIPSTVMDFGGASFLTDISNSRYVVGYGAVELTNAAASAAESLCADLTGEQLQVCGLNLKTSLAASGVPIYTIRAHRWQLDENNDIVDTKDLGLLFTPKDTDTRSHGSVATAVNESGNVAGYSDGYRNDSDFDNDRATRVIATYWDGATETLKSFVNQDDYFESKSLDINDNNLVVGYATRFIGTVVTRQFFIYDGNTETLKHPDGFFSSSASTAWAVNNNGIIVGTAEVETSFGTDRRERGFMYDSNTETMTNLNTLLSCDNPYTIAEARDINDDGVIVGTALKRVALKDSQGNAVTNDAGEAQFEEVARAVRLIPVAGGTVEDCNAVTTPTYERQGAGWGMLSLFGIGLAGLARRRFGLKKSQ